MGIPALGVLAIRVEKLPKHVGEAAKDRDETIQNKSQYLEGQFQ